MWTQSWRKILEWLKRKFRIFIRTNNIFNHLNYIIQNRKQIRKQIFLVKLLVQLLCQSKRCIELRFQRILIDFFMIRKSCGIESRLLWNLNKSCDIQSRQLRLFFQCIKIHWYSIKISKNLSNVSWY